MGRGRCRGRGNAGRLATRVALPSPGPRSSGGSGRLVDDKVYYMGNYETARIQFEKASIGQPPRKTQWIINLKFCACFTE